MPDGLIQAPLVAANADESLISISAHWRGASAGLDENCSSGSFPYLGAPIANTFVGELPHTPRRSIDAPAVCDVQLVPS
jgi:hypothetical protein